MSGRARRTHSRTMVAASRTSILVKVNIVSRTMRLIKTPGVPEMIRTGAALKVRMRIAVN